MLKSLSLMVSVDSKYRNWSGLRSQCTYEGMPSPSMFSMAASAPAT